MKDNRRKKSPDTGSFRHGWKSSQIMLDLVNNRSHLSELIAQDQTKNPVKSKALP